MQRRNDDGPSQAALLLTDGRWGDRIQMSLVHAQTMSNKDS
jgi:hypothetical protein